MTKEEAKKEIEKLVARFREHRDEYHLPEYNETKTRRDFVDPFFKALGWDIDNSNDAAEAYREVIHEDKVKVNGKMKAPDYGFKLQGSDKKRLFYVEAKKPSVLLKVNKESSFQLRRYGLSAEVHVSILTNFEEFVVYDCSRKPNFNDSASFARLKYIPFEKYIEEFDFIYDTFSRDAVIKGRFDKFVKSDTYKKGSQVLDKYFVETLNDWRTRIATSIALNNLELNEDDINFVVQQTIDRIIFLRFCEDRGVEPSGQMQKAIASGNSFKNLLSIFQQADDKYNSGLFDFKKDRISGNLKIDNKIFKNISEDLYYPQSTYDFRVMPIEILGDAYEQFLGKVIRITKGSHHAVIDDKPEVRKAGGVYYTPQYIVRYIVANTVGKLVEGKSPKDIEKIKIVDPACGSGSFLIGAFQYLLDYHVQWYTDKGFMGKKTKDNPLTPDGKLTSAEKKKILLNNIYGVDIDTNAVEVTKLSLLLKCMEGETQASIKQQLSVFHERVLPDLDNNIKSGNSLIDTDFYESELDYGYEKKIKPFSWQKGFAEVFKQGGFDAVIGNPPYGAMFIEPEMKYFLSKFKIQNYQYDSYFLFIEKSLGILKSGALLGFIIPNTWLLNLTTSKIRQHLFSMTEIENIVHYKNPVFTQAVVDTEVIIFRNIQPHATHVIQVDFFDKQNQKSEKKIKQQNWIDANGSPVNLLDNENNDTIKNKISALPNLDSICKITQGAKPFQVGKGKPIQTRKIVNEKQFVSERQTDRSFRPLLRGSLMNRYQINWNKNYWIKFGDWLAEPRYSADYYAPEKLIIRQTGDHLVGTIDIKQFIVRDNLYTITIKKPKINLRYILGLINSNFLNWYYQNILNPEKGEALAQVKRGHIALLPIKEVDRKNKSEVQKHDEIIKHVNLLLKLNEELKEAKLPYKIEQIKSRIGYSENKINELVYELYGLTKEEIKIVEGE